LASFLDGGVRMAGVVGMHMSNFDGDRRTPNTSAKNTLFACPVFKFTRRTDSLTGPFQFRTGKLRRAGKYFFFGLRPHAIQIALDFVSERSPVFWLAGETSYIDQPDPVPEQNRIPFRRG